MKVYEVRQTPSDGKSSHGLWPGELKMSNLLHLCTKRNLTILGKFLIIKSLIAPIFTYMTSACVVPEKYRKEIDSKYFKFIWNITFSHWFHSVIRSLTITPSGMIKADRKGKTSGLENLRPYHRMESMRKSNILSWLLSLLVSSSRIRTYSLLYWPKVIIPHCGGPFFWMSLGIIPFSTIFWQCYLIHLPIMSHFYIYFYF